MAGLLASRARAAKGAATAMAGFGGVVASGEDGDDGGYGEGDRRGELR